MSATCFYSSILLAVWLVPAGRADMLELKNGIILNGRYNGGTAGTVRFETSAGLQIIETARIVALTFTTRASSASRAAAAAPPAAAARPRTVTLPAGMLLLVRIMESISSRNTPGTRFTTKLEYDLGLNGVVVLRAGTTLYGKVQSSSQAGHVVGRSTLDLRLNQIVVGSQNVPILTTGHKEAGPASIAKVAKGAGAGATIGRIAGDAGKGAVIGATAGALVGGETITVTPGTLLEFLLNEPVTLTVVN